MEEAIFPPSPSWFSPNIIAACEDGTVAYGAKNSIIILKTQGDKSTEPLIIHNAHTQKVTSVAFSPSNCSESVINTIASCSEDGLVKLWKVESLSAFLGHKSHWEKKAEIGKVICLDWSRANPHHIISAAENDSLVVWDILSNTTVKFSFQKLGATVIACCLYNEKIVAVGSKTGKVYIINLSGEGDIVYKLRGHDNKIHSLSWCPVPFNVFKTTSLNEEFLLASACQDKEVFVWRAGTDGKCEIKYQIPTTSLSKKDGIYGKVGNSFSYSDLCWSDPYKIYFSSNFGELLYFDVQTYLSTKLANSGQKVNKQNLGSFKLGHSFHTKGLFAITGTPYKGEIKVYEKNKIMTDLRFKIESNSCSIVEGDKNLEKKVIWEVSGNKTLQMLWSAGQDRRLIGCEVNSNTLDLRHNFHTVNGFVYCAVVSPHDPNKIAIGVGDGMIRLWNLTESNGEMLSFWQKIKDRVMALAWHPTRDGLLAYGTSEGRVGLIDTNSNKLPNLFKPSHPHSIYNLSWGPSFPTTEENSNLKTDFNLYAVGDYTLSVYDPSRLSADSINLSKILPFPCKKQTDVCWKPDYSLMAVGNEDGSICLVEPTEFKIVYTVLAYKKLIQSIAWHPTSTSLDSGISPYHGYFTSGSTDNNKEIRVFNCVKEENEVKVNQVALLTGHHGHIQSVSWCPHVSGRLISSSADCSVQIWDVISQTPLVNYNPSGLPIFSTWSPIDSDIILTGCRNDLMDVWRISKQTKTSPTLIAKNKKQKKDKSIQMGERKETIQESKLNEKEKENGIADVAVAEPKGDSKTTKEVKMFSKAWKKELSDELDICYSLLKKEKLEENEMNYSLAFLNGEEEFKELIRTEEEFCKKSNNWTEYCELALWNGNIKEVLEEKIKSGQLNDFLVSLTPIISPRLWQEACLSYSKSLVEKKQFRKASSYLMACHKLYDAVEVLLEGNLYLEALCVARSRFPKTDPVMKRILGQYAEKLFRNGAYAKACECFIYLEDYSEVAKICGKKSRPEYLSLAALAAKKCGSSELECLEANNALLKCFEVNDFELAQRVCHDHRELKHLQLLFNTFTTIHKLNSEELFLEKDIFTYLKEITDTDNVAFPESSRQLYHQYTFYKNEREVLIVVAQELSFAICAKDLENLLIHLIKALSTCYRYMQTSNEIHLLYKLCSWVCPGDFLGDSSFFKLKENNLLLKVKSLRAFLCSAISKYLSDNSTLEEVHKFLNTIVELKDDLMDEDSYKYYRNLIQVQVYEKKLMTKSNKGGVNKVTNGEKRDNEITNGFHENGVNNPERLEQNNSELNESQENGNENLSEDSEESFESSGNCPTDQYLEEEIVEDKKLLNKLKIEIQNFESIRISSPNPVPVYFTLKKALERIPENESARSILDELQQKWFELNK